MVTTLNAPGNASSEPTTGIYLNRLNPAVFSENMVARYIQYCLREHAGVTD
jgi:hypothetical protein